MSNIKFHTNRQVALQMALEEAKRTIGSTGSTRFVLETADAFYQWLQDAPMKDQDIDNKFWLDGSTKTKPKDKL
jgi:hypothetical protein